MLGGDALRRDLTLPRVARHEQALKGAYIQRAPGHVGRLERSSFLPPLLLEILLEVLVLLGIL